LGAHALDNPTHIGESTAATCPPFEYCLGYYMSTQMVVAEYGYRHEYIATIITTITCSWIIVVAIPWSAVQRRVIRIVE